MMIDCPSCATAYHVTQPAIGAGRAVVCPRCAAQWFVRGSGTAQPVRVEAVARRADRAMEPMATAAPAPARKSRAQAKKPWRTAALVAGLAFPALAFGLRAPLLRLLPPGSALAAQFVPGTGVGLAVRGLVGTRASETAAATLVVRGEIANLHGASAGVPNLALSVEDATGHEVYRWTAQPPVRRLAPGAAATFTFDLPRVPAAGQRVAIRFAAAERP